MQAKTKRQAMKKPTTKPLKLAEIGARISAHLQRIEKDPKINVPLKYNDVLGTWQINEQGRRRFYNASASATGSRVYVSYVSYQGGSYLSKADALKYLAWLDAGNVGKHIKVLG